MPLEVMPSNSSNPQAPPAMDRNNNKVQDQDQQRRDKSKRRASQENRYRRARYHLLATNHRLPSDPENESDYLFSVLANPRRRSLHQKKHHRNALGADPTSGLTLEEQELHETKLDLLKELARSGGDPTTPVFRDALDQLTALYSLGGWDAREDPALSRSYHGDDGSTPPTDPVDASGPALEGTWLTLSRPSFPGCVGRNGKGEFMYTLGHMSFSMFRPNELVCSVQGTFNRVEVVRDEEARRRMEDLPKALKNEVKRGESILRTYTIITAFTIEPRNSSTATGSANDDVACPLKGIMTTRGYILPDPDHPHRLSVWFDGGTIEPVDDTDLDEWKALLGDANGAASPSSAEGGKSRGGKEGNKSKKSSRTGKKRPLSGRAKIFAARMLMGASPPEENGGMESNGSVSYRLRRPMGGHGKTYVDVRYLDGTMRIMRGNMGSVYVFVRVPEE